VYFGGNDSHLPHPSGLGPHVPLEEYIQNMTKIANYLKVKFVIEFHFPILIVITRQEIIVHLIHKIQHLSHDLEC